MAMRHGQLSVREKTDRLGKARDKRDAIVDPDLQARWETLIAIKSLRRNTSIQYAEPNYRVNASFRPDDEAFPFQWHYPLIDLPAAWDTVTGNPSVTVAVIDTGILSRHPDLASQLVPGYDFVRNAANAGDASGIDPDPEDPGNRSAPGSSSYHGTHVAGTVAATGNNGLGVAGVAWSARIMPLRALGGSGSGTSYDVNQAIRFAAGLPNDSGTVPEQPVDIINLSLGGGGFSQADQDLLNQVRAAGILVVAAAGNEANTLPAYPASYNGVISVSAVDSQSRLARYSNTGASIDIAAPGGDNGADLNGDGYPDGVLSTGGTGAGASTDFAYTFLSGTSMASPHVAGVLALMKSVNPSLIPDDIDALLARGDLTDDLGPAGRDNQYGHGLVNAQRAVLAAIEAGGSSPANDPRLVASASTLNFGISANSLALELRNGGRGILEIESLEATPDWLSIAPQRIDDGGLGLYRVTVDRSGLQDGVYSGTLTADAAGNTISIRVLLSVGDAGNAADVGLVYILLHDVDQDLTQDQVATTSVSGLYHYRFDQVPPGRYEIVAGSDADNDLFICDPGEACGAWLTIDRPIVLTADSNLQDLDFPIEYLVSIPNISGTAKTEIPGRARPRAGKSIAKFD
jgi:serine protease